MFTFKTADEFEQMTDEQAKEYRNDMNDHLIKLEKELKDALANKIEGSDLEQIKQDLTETKEALIAQGLEMKKNTKEVEEKTVQMQIKDALLSNVEKLKELKNNKVRFDFTVKAVGTMTTGASLTGEIPQAMRIAGVNPVAVRQPFIGQLINSGTTTSPLISWVEEVTGEGAAGLTAEGVAKNQMDIDFKVGSEYVRKITVFVKVSEEMLEDIDFMATTINTKLLQRLDHKIDQQVLLGTAGGVQLNGIYTQATAFSAGTFALSVVTPNLYDVVKVAINQIAIANHNANYIVLHPSDAVALSLKKNATSGTYLFPTFTLPGGKTIDGLPVVTNTGMTAGNFLVGDFTKATSFYKSGIRIEAGWDADDFTKNLRTILAEARLALVIEGNDKTAFVKGVIGDAVTALTKA